MSRFRLRPSGATSAPSNLSTREFLWRPRPLESSFHTTLSSGLEELGKPDRLHRDLVRVAVLVYLVDRTAKRPRRGWQRELRLEVPVADPEPWGEAAAGLEDLLGFLSGDLWTLDFRKRRFPKRGATADVRSKGAVCLFSGGADSLAGAISLGEAAPPTLVSHRDWTVIGGRQRQLVDRLDDLWEAETEHQAVWIGRRKEQIGSGEKFPKEGSSRSRSFLFIALGLAAASLRGGELTMAENGYASLNVPLTGERRGALSTRTTHPAFLDGLQALLAEIGINGKVTNPFEEKTKGEIFAEVKGILGNEAASDLLSASHSCAKPLGHWAGQSPAIHCGLCFGCLVRRAAFIAAGLKDETDYLDNVLSGEDRTEYLERQLDTYRAVQHAIAIGVDEAAVLELGLPNRISVADALALARRGLDELGKVEIE